MPSKVDLIDNDGCFACGKLNPVGLHLEFDIEGDEYVTYWTPEVQQQGWNGIVHGGIVTTVFDEVMARALHVRGIRAVTGEITARFRKPTPIGKRLRFAGRIVSEEGRVIACTATATDPDGVLLAEATAKMVRV